MALRPTTSKASAWLVSRAEVATAMAPATRSGKLRGPGEHHVSAQRSADHCPQPPDAQVIDQPPLHLDDVADGDGGKVRAIAPARGRVDGVGPGRAAAAAENIGTNDEVAIGVDGLARSDHDLPPAGVILGIVPGHVRIARQGVANQHGVVALGIELPVGLKSHGNFRQFARPVPARAAGGR